MALGGLWGVGKGDLAVVIASVGPGSGQTADLVGTLRKLGARVFLVADERVAWRFPLLEIRAEGGSSFSYPVVPEPLSPALAVLPVQLSAAFAAHLLGRGTDPGRVSASGGCAHSPLAAAGAEARRRYGNRGARLFGVAGWEGRVVVLFERESEGAFEAFGNDPSAKEMTKSSETVKPPELTVLKKAGEFPN